MSPPGSPPAPVFSPRRLDVRVCPQILPGAFAVPPPLPQCVGACPPTIAPAHQCCTPRQHTHTHTSRWHLGWGKGWGTSMDVCVCVCVCVCALTCIFVDCCPARANCMRYLSTTSCTAALNSTTSDSTERSREREVERERNRERE